MTKINYYNLNWKIKINKFYNAMNRLSSKKIIITYNNQNWMN